MAVDRDEFLSRRSKFVVDRSTATGDYIRIGGLEEAITALRELPRQLRVGALRKGLRAAGNVIKQEARGLAPVLGGSESSASRGRLARRSIVRNRIPGLVRDSISVRGSRLARKRGDLGVYVTVRRLTRAQVSAGKAAGYGIGKNPRDPFYFKFLEMGTRKMAARSFLGPALKSKSAEATEVFSSELRRAIVMANQKR